MATRKARPRDKKPPSRSSPDPVELGEDEPRPSSSMTREIDIIAVEALAAGMSEPDVAPYSAPTRRLLEPVVPPAPSTSESLDDLAQTIEAPAAPRMALLDAAESLVADLGFARTTDDAIARYAGVSTDVLRAHFASASALLRALAERLSSHVVAAADDAIRRAARRRASPDDLVAVAVRTILEVLLARAALVRAIIASGDARLLEALRTIPAGVSARATRALARTAAPADEADVTFALLLASALAHHAIVLGSEIDHDELCLRAGRAATAYLGRAGTSPTGQD